LHLLKNSRRVEIRRLRRGERLSGSHPAQFEHPVADVAILRQMGGSDRFAAGSHHLVERAPLKELGIEIPAEFARTAGACVEAIDDGWVNVFHERRLLGGLDGAQFVRQSHMILPRTNHESF
jgi:hypothetical protein